MMMLYFLEVCMDKVFDINDPEMLDLYVRCEHMGMYNITEYLDKHMDDAMSKQASSSNDK